jgi:hypothetical protein
VNLPLWLRHLPKAQAIVSPENRTSPPLQAGDPERRRAAFATRRLQRPQDRPQDVIQNTVVDQASRVLTLTTMLVHSSDEWIASNWPVCSVAEISNPHRTGSALTDARRYALFTLVGIAGEDNLDRPTSACRDPSWNRPYPHHSGWPHLFPVIN